MAGMPQIDEKSPFAELTLKIEAQTKIDKSRDLA